MSYWLAGWLYENAARGARVDCVIELRPSVCFCRVHVGASTKFIRILLVVRLFTRSGGYCVSYTSVWAAEASVFRGEGSEGGRGGGRGHDIVRVASKESSISRSFGAALLPTQQKLWLPHDQPRNREDGASPVCNLRSANLKALRGMWAGELLLPRLPEARVEAPQKGLPAAYRHGHE